jgi:NAD(P)-dependent dehydrogenase (short-subunit alcohol dehydrogenase family)
MFQPDLLKDKVVLITGGGTGLGRSMGTRFLELGAKLAMASRHLDVLEQAASEMSQATGGQVFPLACDVRDPEQVERMIEGVWSHYGTIDVLVNNAAGNFASPTERLSYRAVDSVLGIVLHGTFYCTLALGKKWIEAKRGGVMLNLLATYAWTGSGYVVPSAAAKAGVMALTQSLAVEWAKYGIRMNGIAPGPFPTPGAWERLVPIPELAEQMIQRNPMKRVGDHTELANLAAFLISDYSSYINGDVIVIDGGEWLYGAGEFSHLDKLPPEAWDMFAALTRGKR